MNKKKKTHGVQLLLRCVVRDPDGKIITDTGRKSARSFVIQILEAVYGIFRAVTLNATRTTGAEGTLYRSDIAVSSGLRVSAGVNDSTYGVVVGTGDTAATNTDIVLETQLTEGVGLGNITHASVVFVSAVVVGANVDLEISRAFTNNTGAAITVKEAGIYCYYTGGPFYHCLVRDVLSPPIDVPDSCSLTVFYTLRTTV